MGPASARVGRGSCASTPLDAESCSSVIHSPGPSSHSSCPTGSPVPTSNGSSILRTCRRTPIQQLRGLPTDGHWHLDGAPTRLYNSTANSSPSEPTRERRRRSWKGHRGITVCGEDPSAGIYGPRCVPQSSSSPSQHGFIYPRGRNGDATLLLAVAGWRGPATRKRLPSERLCNGRRSPEG
jgi:hypothetical protein